MTDTTPRNGELPPAPNGATGEVLPLPPNTEPVSAPTTTPVESRAPSSPASAAAPPPTQQPPANGARPSAVTDAIVTDVPPPRPPIAKGMPLGAGPEQWRKPMTLKPTKEGEVYDFGTFTGTERRAPPNQARPGVRDPSLYHSTGALSTSALTGYRGAPDQSLYSSYGSMRSGGRRPSSYGTMDAFDAALSAIRKEHVTCKADLDASREQVIQLQDAMSRMNADLLNVAPMHRENQGLKQERDVWVQRERQAAGAKDDAEKALLLERQRADDLQRKMGPLSSENEMLRKEREAVLAQAAKLERDKLEVDRQLHSLRMELEQAKLEARRAQQEAAAYKEAASYKPPPQPAAPPPAPIVGVGMVLGHTEGQPGFSVSKLVIGGPAADSRQIHPGDKLIRIEGQDVQSWDLDAITKSVRGPEGSNIKLDFLTPSGTINSVTITRRAAQSQAAIAAPPTPTMSSPAMPLPAVTTTYPAFSTPYSSGMAASPFQGYHTPVV